MKKIFIILFSVFVYTGTAQVLTIDGKQHQFASAITVNSDRSYAFDLQESCIWNIDIKWTSNTHGADTAYAKLQVLCGTNWCAYPGLDSIAVNGASGYKSFSGTDFPFSRFRVYIDIYSGDSFILNGYYTFKRKLTN